MGHNYKPTAITRVGFACQDLVAAETLLEFYRNPNKYQWVQVEASDPSFRAVDDVVACRADGRFELTQVKFAVDRDNPMTALDWEWLLATKPRGKSLLQHWAAPVTKHVDVGLLASACLKTDRKPNADFSKALEGSRVSYSKIPAAIRKRIVTQLGSTATAQKFFANFDFIHSQPVLEDLDAILWTRISSDTDSAGWALFQKQLQLWATQKNSPHPDGRSDMSISSRPFRPNEPSPFHKTSRCRHTIVCLIEILPKNSLRTFSTKTVSRFFGPLLAVEKALFSATSRPTWTPTRWCAYGTITSSVSTTDPREGSMFKPSPDR